MENPLGLKSLNHISILCSSMKKSVEFYQNVLGFFLVRRPSCFDFDGAWLYNYGIGIHLLQSEDPDNIPQIRHINPKDNHISFQCESMKWVEKQLKEKRIEYVKSMIKEGGIYVDQIFFHDPDGLMIEICNCDNLPIIPISLDFIQSSSPSSCSGTFDHYSLQRSDQLMIMAQQIQSPAVLQLQQLLTTIPCNFCT